MKLFSSKLKSSADFYTQIALILVIVLLVNIIFTIAPWRFDLSEARIYSVSSVTKDTLKNLDDVITIKAYFTEDLPGYLISVRQQVKDILAEYKNYGHGRVRITFVNPNASPELEQEANSLGIPPLQFNVVNKDKYEVAQGYLGIAVVYGDKIQTIPVVQEVTNLEYDLTAAIKKVVSGEDQIVGILERQDSLMPKESISLLEQVLTKQYKTRFIDLSTGDLIADDINTLIIPGPSGQFTERELYVVDQFIMSGGAVFVAMDGVSVGDGLVTAVNESNFAGLLKKYGITINQDMIFDGQYNGQASFSQGFVQFFTPYGFWPQILPEGFKPESLLVNKLEALYLPWLSSMSAQSASGTEVLAVTSPYSKAVTGQFDLSPQTVPQASGSGKGNYPAVVSIKGKLSSYFSGPVVKADDTATPNFIKSIDQAKLIVVSDSDLLSDSFMRRFSENMIFIQNVVDGLTLDESLAAIRSKDISSRPISELDDTARVLVKYGNIVGIPVIIIIYALIHFLVRRRSQRASEL